MLSLLIIWGGDLQQYFQTTDDTCLLLRIKKTVLCTQMKYYL